MGTTVVDRSAPDDPSSPTDAAAPADARSRSIWGRSLGVHTAAYLLLLLLLLPFARPGVATPDEGAYALQARRVADGHWQDTTPLTRYDPTGRWYPIIRATEAGDRWYPYVKHPAFPLGIAAVMRVAGEGVGLVLLPMLGALLAAVAAWLLAGEIDRRWSRPAFWLAALGPVLFSAYVTWAHSLSAALAGASLIALVRTVSRGPRWTRTAGLATALAGGVLLRSEAVLWTGAVLATLGVVVLARRSLRLAVPLVGSAVAVGLTLVAENRWVAHIIGGAAPHDLVLRSKTTDPSFVEAKIEGFWHSTLQGPPPVEALAVLALAVVTVIVVRTYRGAGDAAALALVGLGMLSVLMWVREPTGMTKGLLAAAPVLVIGVAVLLASRRCPPLAGLLLGVSGLFAVAVYATQYADGGAFQWGGRFLSPALVPLAVVAAGGLVTAWEARPVEGRVSFARAVAVLVVSSAIVAVGSLGASRAGIEPLYGFIDDHASPVNVTTAEELPRMMWREDLPWLRAPADGLPSLLRTLHERGATQVTVVARPAEAEPATTGWRVTDAGPVGSTGLHAFVLRA